MFSGAGRRCSVQVSSCWMNQVRGMAKTPAGSKRKPTGGSKKSFPAFPGYTLKEGVRLVQAFATKKFEETVEICVVTSADPRKPNQMIRGVATLPHGLGKAVRVAVFAKDAKADEARAAGADIVGGQDLADQILAGKIDFDRVMATPDMMPMVGKVARILGPKGLMPNPKLGTVTMNIEDAVQKAKLGEIQYKCDNNGVVLAAIGKAGFDSAKLFDNIAAFTDTLIQSKPEGVKGQYFHKVYISSAMGKSVKLDITAQPFPFTSSF